MTAPASEPTRDEVLALAQMVCDGTITASDRDRLEAILQARPDLRAGYLDYCGVNAALISRYRTGGKEDGRPLSRQPTSAGRFRFSASTLPRWAIAFALATCALIAFSLQGWDGRAPAPADSGLDGSTSSAIATIRESTAAVWWEEAEPLNVGDRFAPGRLQLKEGSAELVLDSGVRLVLEGPASLSIDSPDGAFLASGKVAVHVPEPAIGFTLSTPTSKLVDQGTEFGVVADEDGVTEVHVFRGQVDLVYALDQEGPNESQRIALTSQQARRILESNTEGEDVGYSLDRFRGLADRINEPFEWSLAEGGNGHFYQLVFFDRAVSWQEAAADAYVRHHRGLPGHLLTVTSPEEHQFVLDKLLSERAIKNAWIGFTDAIREGYYEWITGEPFDYECWGQHPVRQPDNFIEREGHGGEDYGSYARLPGVDWFWNDTSNDSMHHSMAVAIVEYESPTQQVLARSVPGIPVTWKPEDGGNGNIYRLVLSLDSVGWDVIRQRAEETSVHGVSGRLACLETESERDFVREHILKVCSIPVNAIGLSGGSTPDSVRWINGAPLDITDRVVPRFPAGRVFGQLRWANLAWKLQTVPTDQVSPGWFGYLIEYPLGEPPAEPALAQMTSE